MPRCSPKKTKKKKKKKKKKPPQKKQKKQKAELKFNLFQIYHIKQMADLGIEFLFIKLMNGILHLILIGIREILFIFYVFMIYFWNMIAYIERVS